MLNTDLLKRFIEIKANVRRKLCIAMHNRPTYSNVKNLEDFIQFSTNLVTLAFDVAGVLTNTRSLMPVESVVF